MIFTDIRLQNYRSYDEASFELGRGVNIVMGPNAAGKTNLLEALMVAAVGKSYRARDHLLVRNGSSWLRLDVHTNDNQTRVVKVVKDAAEKPTKTFEIDEKVYKRLPLQLKQPVVLFQPDDLRLLHGEPQQRRDYIDDLLEQLVPGYQSLRVNLRRVVAQRNALLKQPSVSQSQLFAWNLRLCDVASQVVAKRHELISQFNQQISETYSAISGKNTSLSIVYTSKTPIETYSATLMKQLDAQLELDRRRGFTSRGPHRDDMLVYFDEELLSNTASRGENRTFMLSLKVLELAILEASSGKRPLLLLDDVFSELDGARRKALTNYLSDYQTLITTTDADVIAKSFTENSNLIII